MKIEYIMNLPDETKLIHFNATKSLIRKFASSSKSIETVMISVKCVMLDFCRLMVEKI